MKKIIIILAIGLASCTTRSTEIIDGCEYIVSTSSGGDGSIVETLAHKGNCKNPIHNPKPKQDTAFTFKPVDISNLRYGKE